MPKFFVKNNQIENNIVKILGEDVKHISNVLRMKLDDEIQVCDTDTSNNYIVKLKDFSKDEIIGEIKEKILSEAESNINITIFQGIPKSDKMELIIQKAVELGAYSVVPVAMKRSVVKLDAKKAKAKVERWNGIALSAAKQSKRSIQPEVTEVMTFKQALEYAGKLDKLLLPYECAEGMEKTRKVIEEIGHGESVGIFIGPEGGFDRSELDEAVNAGCEIITLGKRILRTETAGMMLLSVLMYNMEE